MIHSLEVHSAVQSQETVNWVGAATPLHCQACPLPLLCAHFLVASDLAQMSLPRAWVSLEAPRSLSLHSAPSHIWHPDLSLRPKLPRNFLLAGSSLHQGGKSGKEEKEKSLLTLLNAFEAPRFAHKSLAPSAAFTSSAGPAFPPRPTVGCPGNSKGSLIASWAGCHLLALEDEQAEMKGSWYR